VIFTALIFVAIIVVAIAAFIGVVYLIVRFRNRGDDIAVDPGNSADGPGSESKPPE